VNDEQDVILVDGSGSGKCVLWKDKIGSLKEGCYLLKSFVVWEYGSKFLSMAKEGCEIVPAADIGETVPNDEVLEEDDYKPSTSYQAPQPENKVVNGCYLCFCLFISNCR